MTLTSMVNTRYYNVTVTIDYTPTRQRQCLPSSFPDFFKYLILSCSALTLVEYWKKSMYKSENFQQNYKLYEGGSPSSICFWTGFLTIVLLLYLSYYTIIIIQACISFIPSFSAHSPSDEVRTQPEIHSSLIGFEVRSSGFCWQQQSSRSSWWLRLRALSAFCYHHSSLPLFPSPQFSACSHCSLTLTRFQTLH